MRNDNKNTNDKKNEWWPGVVFLVLALFSLLVLWVVFNGMFSQVNIESVPPRVIPSSIEQPPKPPLPPVETTK